MYREKAEKAGGAGKHSGMRSEVKKRHYMQYMIRRLRNQTGDAFLLNGKYIILQKIFQVENVM